MLRRMTLDIREIHIFIAVFQWLHANQKLEDKLFCSSVVNQCVKLEKLITRELGQIVVPSNLRNLLTVEKVIDLLQKAYQKAQGSPDEM